MILSSNLLLVKDESEQCGCALGFDPGPFATLNETSTFLHTGGVIYCFVHDSVIKAATRSVQVFPLSLRPRLQWRWADQAFAPQNCKGQKRLFLLVMLGSSSADGESLDPTQIHRSFSHLRHFSETRRLAGADVMKSLMKYG